MLSSLLWATGFLSGLAGANAADPGFNRSDLIVGSKRGLEAWARDGRSKRLISPGPALLPRWLDDSTVLVVNAKEENDLGEGARLERVSLADGKRKLLATLPPYQCQPGAEFPVTLEVQEQSDFVVDVAGGKACLKLMDRNINMAEVILAVRVDFKTGKAQRWLELGGDKCKRAKGVKVKEGELYCGIEPGGRPTETTEEAAETATAGQFQFAADDSDLHTSVVDGKGKTVLRLPGYDTESHGSSPSGRWIVLGGDQEDGDYIHRNVVLLDRTTGKVFPIVAGAWPKPLAPVGKKRPQRIRTPIESTTGVVGETEVRWLGDARSEVLLVGDLVVVPGVKGFSVEGELLLR